MFFWVAFGMGLTGSLHCVGMCGPIALSLPYRGPGRLATLGNIAMYNLGRVATYSAMGLLFGLIGQGLHLAGLQSFFSVGVGVLLLLAALLSINLEERINRLPFLARLKGWVSRQLGALLRHSGPGRLFGVGMLNGLLPCGMVYMAIFGALSAGGVLDGMAFMALFGLGTLPMMAAIALGGHLLGLRFRRQAQRLLPVLLAAFAVLFIVRGLQIDLPDVFSLGGNPAETPMCH